MATMSRAVRLTNNNMSMNLRLPVSCPGYVAHQGHHFALARIDSLVVFALTLEEAKRHLAKRTQGVKVGRDYFLGPDERQQLGHHLVAFVEHEDKSFVAA